MQVSMEALGIAEESGDIYSKASAKAAHGLALYLKGDLKNAETHLQTGAMLGQRMNWLQLQVNTSYLLGRIYSHESDFQRSEKYYEEAIRLLTDAGNQPSSVYLMKMESALARIKENQQEFDLAAFRQYVESNRLKVRTGRMRRTLAEILMKQGVQFASDAHGWIEGAIDADKKNGMKWELANDYAVYGEWASLRGDSKKAKEMLTKAVQIFNECGADGWARRYEGQLAQFL